MDFDSFIRGSLLIVLMFAFLGMFIWAWSKDRKKDFEQMGRLPLDDDDIPTDNIQ